MPLFSIDLSNEFQSFLIVEALSAAIGIGVMKLHSGRTFVSVLGYPVFGRRFHRKDLHCDTRILESWHHCRERNEQ